MPMEFLQDAYDFLAWLCYLVSALPEKQRLMSQYQSRQKDYQATIQQQFYFLDGKQTENAILHDFMTATERQILSEQIDLWQRTESDRIYLIAMLEYLDGYLDLKKGLAHFGKSLLPENQQQGFLGFSALNQNEQAVKGRLAPWLKPLWYKKNPRSREELEGDPLAVMKNYCWIPYTEHNWDIRQIYVLPEIMSAQKEEPFRIVLSPLTKRCPFNAIGEYDEKQQKNIFRINYNTEEQKHLKQAINRTLDYAAEQQASIVLFPEMLADEKLHYAIQEHLEEMNLPAPELVFPPSAEYQINKEDEANGILYQNTLHILTATGGEVFEYHKQNPFQFDGDRRQIGKNLLEPVEAHGEKQELKYYEPIESDHRVVVFHIEGVGRIAVIICADVFSEELKELLFKRLRVSLLLVLAYTFGTDMFFRCLSNAEESSTDVVWCNTCCAYKQPTTEDVVGMYFSYGHKEVKKFPICSCGTNTERCNACAIMVDIPLNYTGKGKVDREDFSEI